MKQKLSDWIERYKCMDIGVLYLRMVLGTCVLFHNIGKMQVYNEIINSYPSLLHMGSPASFVIVSVAEVLLAVLLMLGLWVRVSAVLLALGMIWIGLSLGLPAGEPALLYAAVSIFLVIAGGGIYAFDTVILPRKSRKTIK